MITISEAIEELVDAQPALGFGFYHDLLNLTRVARYLKPSIEARAKKEVTEAAVLMNLSRRQKKLGRTKPSPRTRLVLDRIHIQSGLASITVRKTAKTHGELSKVYHRLQSKDGFITVTEGLREVTVIVEASNLERVTTAIHSAPKSLQRDLASVSVGFSARYLQIKGILHQILEEVALQDINVLEIASTATEFSVFLHEDDVQLAFDAIYNRFSRRPAGR